VKRATFGKLLTRLKMLVRDKHSSLLRKFLNYGRKKFSNIFHRRKREKGAPLGNSLAILEIIRLASKFLSMINGLAYLASGRGDEEKTTFDNIV